MQKKINYLILLIIFISLSMANTTYAQLIPKQNIPYGPKISELKHKEDILRNFENIKTIRSNLTTINLTGNSTSEQLVTVNTTIKNYIQELETVRQSLENHRKVYSDSNSDTFFSQQISFIGESYIISLRYQQNLIRALEGNVEEAKRLFYSSYLIPVYYYLTLGDEMTAYIDSYFTYPS